MSEAHSMRISVTKEIGKQTSTPFSRFHGAHILLPVKSQENLITMIHDSRTLYVEK